MDHRKGDEGGLHVNFSDFSILPGGQPDEKSGLLVKGVEMILATAIREEKEIK